MSKSNVVAPNIYSAKALSDHSTAVLLEVRKVMGDIAVTPETKAKFDEASRIRDEIEDRSASLARDSLDELSPHARAAMNRLLGTPRDPE